MLLHSLTVLAFAVQASPADHAIDAAVGAYARIRTARAQFEQTVSNALTGSKLSSRGEFEQERPDKFAFRFSSPKGDVIVSDGKSVWLYLPSSAPGQVIRSSLAAGPAGSLDLIGEFFSNPRSRYTITDGGAATVNGRTARIVKLMPRQRDATFLRAQVWIDPQDGSLLEFEAEEASGVTRHVRITSFAPNVAVTRGAFVFKVPKGVRVVDGSALGGRG
jgi:outer membrane lipoprotein carrier protein